MKKSLVTALIFSVCSFNMSGCAFLDSQFQTKSNMGMFGGCVSGLAVGLALMGNPGGGALGCMVGTAVGTFVGEIFDKKVASREEALMRYALKDVSGMLLIDDAFAVPHNLIKNAHVQSTMKYTVLAPDSLEKITITETQFLFNQKDGFVKVSGREVPRTQGTHLSVHTFSVPEKMLTGDSIFISIISDGVQTRSAVSPVVIL
jgi:hypothetical protein